VYTLPLKGGRGYTPSNYPSLGIYAPSYYN
jgi:hypothetical protein